MNIYYNGNTRLQKCGVRIPDPFRDIEKTKEIIKCSDDIVYFARHYMEIDLYDDQISDLNKIRDGRNITLSGIRNSGRTTTLIIKALHYIIFNSDRNVGIICQREHHSKDLLDQIKIKYEQLPMWLKHGVKVWNKKNIELENGTQVNVGTATWHQWGGVNYSLMLIDNFTMIDNFREFYNSFYPSILSSKEGKIVKTI